MQQKPPNQCTGWKTCCLSSRLLLLSWQCSQGHPCHLGLCLPGFLCLMTLGCSAVAREGGGMTEMSNWGQAILHQNASSTLEAAFHCDTEFVKILVASQIFLSLCGPWVYQIHILARWAARWHRAQIVLHFGYACVVALLLGTAVEGDGEKHRWKRRRGNEF